MIISVAQDTLYVITAVTIVVTTWFVIPRPWRRRPRTGG
jgi:hypothetical protein